MEGFLKIFSDGSKEWCGVHVFIGDNDFIVQQFIGAIDKNGNEIYEGDILNNYLADWFGSVELETFSGANIIDHNDKKKSLPLSLYDWIWGENNKEGEEVFKTFKCVNTEIVGNIFQK